MKLSDVYLLYMYMYVGLYQPVFVFYLSPSEYVHGPAPDPGEGGGGPPPAGSSVEGQAPGAQHRQAGPG